MPQKKNCYNCKHLEYIEAEAWDNNGYCCNNRDYKYESQEDKHLKQLQQDAYLKKGKSCFESRD